MPGISKMIAKMLIADQFGNEALEVEHALSQTIWFPFNAQVADSVTEQAIIVLGTQGLTTITALILTSDQDISVTYGAAGSNVPIPLSANGLHAMSNTSLTALSISNASGSTANVRGMVAGS